ncbi:hypothetical protein [Sphingomonas sp. CROZ-RG-20F-R02-07]|uniref:hypothetical protein n=1 Tax=Sphingomonas sp. CROZ-RG-20F-R02-07 TaxID=2914832 RepID=UPI001F5845D8|nr:hypothetical protein [Sphingomonas sp. CROZ-RG-20F-R02-07]
MGLFDGLLGQIAGSTDVANLAAKVGLTPEQVEQAIAALGQQHTAPGDTVAGAADQTGLPTDTLQQILGHLGGEGALGKVAAILGGGERGGAEQGGIGGILGGLFGKS